MATLLRWNPTPGADAGEGDEEAARGGFLVPADIKLFLFERRDRVALHRAATLNGCAERIFHPNPNLEGTPWYDALEQIVDIEFEYVVDGETRRLHGCEEATPPRGREPIRNGHADRITAHVFLKRGDAGRTMELATDFLVLEEHEADPRRAGVLVTADCEEGLDELAELLEHALFEPGGKEDDDSFETQQSDFREAAHEAVCRLMLDAQTVEVEVIRYAVRSHVMHKLPNKRLTLIRMHEDDVEIELLPDESAESTTGG